MISPAVHDPLLLFRFAIRERDWPLAGALAEALWGSARERARLEAELRAACGATAPAPSLASLRALAALIRGLRPGRRE